MGGLEDLEKERCSRGGSSWRRMLGVAMRVGGWLDQDGRLLGFLGKLGMQVGTTIFVQKNLQRHHLQNITRPFHFRYVASEPNPCTSAKGRSFQRCHDRSAKTACKGFDTVNLFSSGYMERSSLPPRTCMHTIVFNHMPRVVLHMCYM